MIGLLWEDAKRVEKLEEELSAKGSSWEVDLVKKCVESAKTAAGGDPSVTWETNFTNKLKNDLTPVFELFMKTSSAPNKPGDLLEAKLDRLDKEILDLRSKVSGLHPAASGSNAAPTPTPSTGAAGGMGLWSKVPGAGATASAPSSIPPSVSNSGFNIALNRTLALENAVKDLQSALDKDKIEVAGQVFESRAHTKAWLQVNAAATGLFVHFLDPSALINVGSNTHTSNEGVMKFEADSIKAGHTGEEEALVSASFKIKIPSLFGTDSQNKEATKDTRNLPGVASFKDWDTGDGHTGAKYVLTDASERSRLRMTASASANLTGLALLVATTMITNPNNFWVVVSTWVTQLYRDLVGRGGHPNDTWSLLCQSLRKIFRELYNRREPGRGVIAAADRPMGLPTRIQKSPAVRGT